MKFPGILLFLIAIVPLIGVINPNLLNKGAKKPFSRGIWAAISAITIALGFLIISLPEKKEEIQIKEVTTPAAPVETKEKSQTEDILKNGQQGYLKENCYVAIDETAEDEMYDYLREKNRDALQRMLVEGRIILAKKGTKVTFVDIGLFSSKIEIIETGKRGLVPSELLAK